MWKWVELSGLLHEVFEQSAVDEKRVIFTEHRDTLSYLQNRISRVLGSADAMHVIHGSMGREDRYRPSNPFETCRVRVEAWQEAADDPLFLGRRVARRIEHQRARVGARLRGVGVG
jgi:hypothetical protein